MRLSEYDAFEVDAYLVAAHHDSGSDKTEHRDPSICIERAIKTSRGGVLPTNWELAQELKKTLLDMDCAMKLSNGTDDTSPPRT